MSTETVVRDAAHCNTKEKRIQGLARRWRLQLPMTQAEFARLFAMAPSTISDRMQGVEPDGRLGSRKVYRPATFERAVFRVGQEVA